MSTLRRRSGTVAVVIAQVLLVGCGGGAAARPSVGTAQLPGLGTVLVDAGGRTLYLFLPDAQQRVSCTGSCLQGWPALRPVPGAQPAVGGAARADLLGVIADGAGAQQVTYNRWPLYTFVGDTSAGQAHGQGLDIDGGLWLAVTPDGKGASGPAG